MIDLQGGVNGRQTTSRHPLAGALRAAMGVAKGRIHFKGLRLPGTGADVGEEKGMVSLIWINF